MIITAKPLRPLLFKSGARLLGLLLKRRFNKLVIHPVDFKPGHSYILMCNHFSFWDGFWLYYLCRKVLWKPGGMRRMYIMSLKKQMQMNPWLRYCGSFSVEPGRRSIKESFAYAAEALSQPGNLLMFFPQGRLESCHVERIQFEHGLAEIVPLIKGPCQLMWSSNIVEYFESIKPSVHFHMLDCGTAAGFSFDELQQKVNAHHGEAMRSHIRFTQSAV